MLIKNARIKNARNVLGATRNALGAIGYSLLYLLLGGGLGGALLIFIVAKMLGH